MPAEEGDPTQGFVQNKNCCCCPCCSVPEGSQIYVCEDAVKKALCTGGGGEPKCSTPVCQPNTCCNGACCQGQNCTVTADIVCQQLGGVFKGCGTTCAPGICGCPPGLVLVDGVCVCPDGSAPCGNVCCPPGWPCVNGVCQDPCPQPGWHLITTLDWFVNNVSGKEQYEPPGCDAAYRLSVNTCERHESYEAAKAAALGKGLVSADSIFDPNADPNGDGPWAAPVGTIVGEKPNPGDWCFTLPGQPPCCWVGEQGDLMEFWFEWGGGYGVAYAAYICSCENQSAPANPLP